MLVAAMNPCPCGFYGDPKRECRCAPNLITKYRNRISGPLLDRIDIHVEVPAAKFLASRVRRDALVLFRAQLGATLWKADGPAVRPYQDAHARSFSAARRRRARTRSRLRTSSM